MLEFPEVEGAGVVFADIKALSGKGASRLRLAARGSRALPLREEIDRLIAESASAAAANALGEMWRNDPGPALAGFLVSRFEKLRGTVPLIPYKVAILR